MRQFKLTKLEIFIVYLSLALFVYSGAQLIRRHYDVVKSAYDITRLKESVSRAQERIEALKVTRARIIEPAYLEQVAGRSGYTQPRQDQIILLYRQEERP